MRRIGKKFSIKVPDEEREDIETGLGFPEDSAGRRMQTELVSVGKDWDVGKTIDYLREEEDLPQEFLDVFVVDTEDKPIGVISLSRILRLPKSHSDAGNLRRDSSDCSGGNDAGGSRIPFEKYDLTTAGWLIRRANSLV